ncbi:MAG: hypothetical protein O3A00_28215 [Planctomycetota bacterium]|nr:hypothetical protein [Planctomycetota bacterium]
MIQFRTLAIFAGIVAGACADSTNADSNTEPIKLGTRLELFIDNHVVGKLSGDAVQFVHEPAPKEVVLVTDQPWEGNTCAYYTIFQDGDLYRMYYRGSHYDEKTKKAAHPEFACYAESRDGIHWKKPELGLFEFNGSKKNNIVWAGKYGTHNFTPFKDPNPNCKPDAKYKALGGGYKRGLWTWESADGIRWNLVSETPVITKGAFDSQNLAFWDPNRKLYVDFHRMGRNGLRDIMTCTSTDFRTWTEPKFLEYTGVPNQHLYTNAIRVYDRAPHIYLGFPTRFHASSQQVEPTLMAGRDGFHFQRWEKAVVPRTAPKDRNANRSNYMTNGLIQLPGNDRELAVYATEAYYTGPDSRVRRFMYRVDGFVSVRAGAKSGTLVTKPVTFSGDTLTMNYATHDGGEVRVELLSAAGEPIQGFSAGDSRPFAGDEIRQVVAWKSVAKLTELVGQPVKIRFLLKNADLYSFQFRSTGQ